MPRKMLHLHGRLPSLIVVATACVAVASAGEARADKDARLHAGLIPGGTLRYGQAPAWDLDLSPSYAIAGEIRYVDRSYAFAFGPRLVELRGSGNVQYEIDIAARVVSRRKLTAAEVMELYFELGYSFVAVPGMEPDWPEGNDAKGFLAGAGVALERHVSDSVSLVVEAGYQYGLQGRRRRDVFIRHEVIAPRFAHAGVGVRTRF